MVEGISRAENLPWTYYSPFHFMSDSMITYVISGVLLIASIWLIGLNAHNAFLCFTGRESRSMIPLLGGGIGALGSWLIPIHFLNEYWWIPLLLDWGCVPGLLYALTWWLFVRRFRGNDPPPR